MNCQEFNECVCEIVDKRLSDADTQKLLEHAAICPHCQFEYEALQTAKGVVKEKVKRKSVPAELYYSIINATINADGSSWFTKLFGVKLNPALAFVAVIGIAVGIYSVFIPNNKMPDEANIISQSIKNYQAVIGGTIIPTLIDKEDNVRTFCEKEVCTQNKQPNKIKRFIFIIN